MFFDVVCKGLIKMKNENTYIPMPLIHYRNETYRFCFKSDKIIWLQIDNYIKFYPVFCNLKQIWIIRIIRITLKLPKYQIKFLLNEDYLLQPNQTLEQIKILGIRSCNIFDIGQKTIRNKLSDRSLKCTAVEPFINSSQ